MKASIRLESALHALHAAWTKLLYCMQGEQFEDCTMNNKSNEITATCKIIGQNRKIAHVQHERQWLLYISPNVLSMVCEFRSH